MTTREEIVAYLKEKKEDFFSDFQVVKLGLFGSFARGEASEASDIDLLVEFQPGTEDLHEKKAKIKAVIENHFHREVDLCREKYIKPYYRSIILQSAIDV